MAKARKFGAFAGVFTPSILTILGVIMYLRLGWVVGEAGLILSIVVILIAHVISISTGLSVSSVATDKKVKAGGLYYILSRSLGLPIGGAIGITLFVGTALSIALYVIGFAESFLDFWGWSSGFQVTTQTINKMQAAGYDEEIMRRLSSIRDIIYTQEKLFIQNLEQTLGNEYFTQAVSNDIVNFSKTITVNDLRITGTITAILVATIAFISTSFAIKTQFFILAAIVLSLIAVFAGTREFAPAEVNLWQPADGESLSGIFGIFFPAVTGFTAGVAMSGDLKDPKKTIPVGTMLAIGVGMIVYISLAIFIAFSIDTQPLREDYNILKRMAYSLHIDSLNFSINFVIAGIWGATLSSALGGILGAPRILQAMSVDKITPKIFGKGVGKNNEPRNALILTFLIAEAGILIGELNAIAEVVSMFYLAAYGFINFSCFLENWASSDFRPQFKIPRLVPITGTISVIIVMAALNLIAMIVAFIIIGAVFLYLVRKQISLGDGDVWDGVWTSVIRRGLNHLVRSASKQRNWRPNIILFSGGASARPHLINFGRALIGELGFLSNFQLVERQSDNISFSKPQQLVPETDDNTAGFFTRKQDCADIYEGMETIARTYGFSGMDPNTILMGWGGDAKNPLRFISSVYTMIRLDYNILMLNYQSERGFGNRELIDIWWTRQDQHLPLTLKLLQFIQKSEEWRKVRFRLLILNEDSLSRNKIYRNASQLLEEMRIEAEIKIVHYEQGHHSLTEILQKESLFTDLVVMGLPELENGHEQDFLNRRNMLTGQLDKSLLLVKSSSSFNVQADEMDLQSFQEEKLSLSLEYLAIPEVKLPESEVLSEAISTLKDKLERLITDYNEKFLKDNFTNRSAITKALKEVISSLYDEMEDEFILDKIETNTQTLSQIHLDGLIECKKIISSFIQTTLVNEKDQYLEGNTWFFEVLQRIINNSPERLNVYEDSGYFQKDAAHEFYEKQQKEAKIFKGSSSNYRLQRLRFRDLLRATVLTAFQNAFHELYKNYNQGNVEFSGALQKLLQGLDDSLQKVEADLSKNEDFYDALEEEKKKALKLVKEVEQAHDYWYSKYNQTLLMDAFRSLQEVSNHLDKFTANTFVRKNRGKIRKALKPNLFLQEAPDVWLHNQSLISKVTLIEAESLAFQKRAQNVVRQLIEELNTVIDDNVLRLLNNLNEYLQAVDIDEVLNSKAAEFKRVNITENEQFFRDIIDRYLKEVKELNRELPESVEMISQESLSALDQDELEELESTSISLARFFDYLIQVHFIQPLLEHTETVPRKFQKVNNVVQYANQLLSSNIARFKAIAEAEAPNFKKHFAQQIKEEIILVEKGKEDILKIQQELSSNIDKSLRNTFVQFSPYAITKEAKSLEQYVKASQSQQALSLFGRMTYSARRRSQDFLINLRYRQSEGKLIARKLQANHQVLETRTEELLNLVEKVSPKKEVLQNLPIYYQQLFITKQGFGSDFWHGRDAELGLATKAYDRFMDRLGGGLMVVGELNSGRSFLCQQIAEQFFYPQNTFYINPPEDGCINPHFFKRIFEGTLEISGSYEEIFDELSSNTVFVFNDIELWWERSENGLAVLDIILDLIDQYGDQCFFILNANIHAYRFINKIKKIDEAFLGIIECEALSAEKLKDIILSRHRSSPITFKLNNTHENEMTEWKYAHLINKHFDYSKGIVGVALQNWISHIDEVEDDMLIIREPSRLVSTPLQSLKDDWILILIQFILHKHLTIKRLARIQQESEANVDRQLKALKRTGLIREKGNDIFRLDPFIEPHLVQEFLKLGLL